MAMTTARKRLAKALLQNYQVKPALDPMFQQEDDSLSSLKWLHSPNAMKIGAASTPTPMPIVDYKEISADPNAILDMSPVNVDPSTVLKTMSVADLPQPKALESTRAKSSHMKPPYSYSTLICMALKEAKDHKLTLADIYSWITNNFQYYRTADLSWQNSIRHNLSLNKSFEKVPRRKDEPGKGGFWRVNPEYCDSLVNGIFKKRRLYNNAESFTLQPMSKRMKQDSRTASIKMEPCEDAAAVLNLQMDDLPSALTGADFNWNTILPQDKETDSVHIKMERHETEVAAASITSLTPPPSAEANDSGFHDFFSSDLGSPVDLSVQGHSIQPQDWWDDDLSKGELPTDLSSSSFSKSMAVFPEQEQEFTHPWTENKSDFEEAIAHFDIDFQNLMEDDKYSNSRTMELVC